MKRLLLCVSPLIFSTENSLEELAEALQQLALANKPAISIKTPTKNPKISEIINDLSLYRQLPGALDKAVKSILDNLNEVGERYPKAFDEDWRIIIQDYIAEHPTEGYVLQTYIDARKLYLSMKNAQYHS